MILVVCNQFQLSKTILEILKRPQNAFVSIPLPEFPNKLYLTFYVTVD